MERFDPTRQAEIGDKLYYERFFPEYAPEHLGEILAIDVETETAYLGKSVLDAMLAAEAAHRNGFFHIVKIGGPAVYKMSYGRPHSIVQPK